MSLEVASAKAATVLKSVAVLARELDGDVLLYLAGMIADGESTESEAALTDAMAPYLESSGVPDVERACAAVYAGLKAAGLIKAPAPPPPSTSRALSGAAAARRALLGPPAGEEEGAPVKLSSAVKLGDNTANEAQLDLLWGRDTNAFLKQNTSIDYDNDIKELAKQAKKADRMAKKEESKAQASKEEAAEAAAAEAAADTAEGRITAGTVTYSLTADRKAQDINISGFSIGIAGNVLIENADLKLSQGRRYGLTGRNGYGKTTLLKAMARGEIMGAGSQKFPTNVRVLHVEQEVSGDDRSVLETVLAADVERTLLLREEGALEAFLGKERDVLPIGGAASTITGVSSTTAGDEDGGSNSSSRADVSVAAAEKRLREISVRLEAIDASTAEARASSILAGLQFTPEMQGWPTRSLSGGWRMRCAIACALFVQPDILLLDEPTNHLDVPAVVWLENYLLDYGNTLVVVSHDRRFLNTVATDVIHLHDKKLTYYKGNYDTFEQTRAERQKQHERAIESNELKRKHVQSFIDKFRFNAKRASLVQSRIKALERMEVLEEMADDPRWKFEFPDPGPIGMPVLQVQDVSFGYTQDRPLFKGANFGIDMDSRIALVGPNGTGKSTLLKLILGELEASAGHVVRNAKLRVAIFTQHHTAQLDMNATPLEYLSRIYPGHKPEVLRGHLSSFGLAADLATQKISTLSGGQKSRVSFAVISWKKPHVLVLDEPTNHLDIETIDAVIVALGNFSGGVICVSHDAHFIESIADEIWVLGNQKVARFKGNFEAYRQVALGEKAERE